LTTGSFIVAWKSQVNGYIDAKIYSADG